MAVRSREKTVSGIGKAIKRRGAALGTGPVGKGPSKKPVSSHSSAPAKGKNVK